ncbi:MAG: TolC family protein [Kiritimatiellales bacterium]
MNRIFFTAGLIGLSLTSRALTLDEALSKASRQSPELRAARAAAKAAEAESRAQAAWNDPELEFEAEGLGGDYSGLDSAEYTLGISQEFPMIGKTAEIRAVGRYEIEAASAETRIAALESAALVRTAFIELLAAQERQRVLDEQQETAREFLDEVRRRQAAGAGSQIDVLQAEFELENLQIEQRRADSQRETAQRNLARLTGFPDLGKADGEFFQTLEKPSMQTVANDHPVLRRFQALENRANAEAVLARRSAVPDLTLGAGVKYEDESNAHSYLVSASIPLPLFGGRRAETIASGLHAEQVRFEMQAARRRFDVELDAASAEFESAVLEVERIRSALLPRAEKAAELIDAGYASGRFGWLEQIESRRTLSEIRLRLIDAQQAAWNARIRLNVLLNEGVEE